MVFFPLAYKRYSASGAIHKAEIKHLARRYFVVNAAEAFYDRPSAIAKVNGNRYDVTPVGSYSMSAPGAGQ